MKKFISIVTFVLFSMGLLTAQGIYEFTMQDIEGNSVSLSDYEGKVVMVVNVASKCGLTKQYEALEALYRKYKDKGFVILGFPCNQFMGQEPGTEAEILEFCTVNYNITFPLFSKIDVNGDDADPLYKYLRKVLPGKGAKSDIEWNFAKFLIDREGIPVERFNPRTKPEDTVASIEKLLEL
jgi:glutathione peroxidase